ncbi:hypothetical protein CYMTET_55714 [Cymbomonas tetramitiformis]|uniref:GHMP kinase N-terminal domain-containing protein n=1 Tax=Cymbomonas tetramitiformis TaxID=36881 RepID=A0AAE0BDL4_9CHLO|nr:hypothetical protein CYMTET_55714 [Cymbomonas tetramitiformis]
MSFELFVPGRLCLLGEHSDWAGGFRTSNPEIPLGATIVVGTGTEGLHAVCQPHPDSLILYSTSDTGEKIGPYECKMELSELLKAAKAGGFFSYACGVAYSILLNHDVKGMEIHNDVTTLPIKKGLSSSAATCVLVARAFSTAYDLKLTTRGEMDYAYRGEILTPSKCGRMDQACAYGSKPVILSYDGDMVDVRELIVAEPIHLVVADLNGGKDTVAILKKLQQAYPFPTCETHEGLHHLLGHINQDIIKRAVTAISRGEILKLAELYQEAQSAFDTFAGAACPEQLTAPLLHSTLEHPGLKEYIFAGKGVGSQGDGTVQFLCKNEAAQAKVLQIVKKEINLTCFKITIPVSDSLKNEDEDEGEVEDEEKKCAIA